MMEETTSVTKGANVITNKCYKAIIWIMERRNKLILTASAVCSPEQKHNSAVGNVTFYTYICMLKCLVCPTWQDLEYFKALP